MSSGEHRIELPAEPHDTLPPEPAPDTERDLRVWRLVDEAERLEEG